jgi:CRP-like cAMP-binding protein
MQAIARWQMYWAGQVLFDTGDPPNAVFGIKNGALDVHVPVTEDDLVRVFRAQPGTWVGDAEVMSKLPRASRVTARVDTLVMCLPASAVHRYLASRPHDITMFCRLGSASQNRLMTELGEALALPARTRFARTLLRLATNDDTVTTTQTELGSMVGMSRAAFRRAFAELIDGGIVKTEYSAIRILDRAALELAAKGETVANGSQPERGAACGTGVHRAAASAGGQRFSSSSGTGGSSSDKSSGVAAR